MNKFTQMFIDLNQHNLHSDGNNQLSEVELQQIDGIDDLKHSCFNRT